MLSLGEMPEHPWLPFFRRLEALATAAFQTIPFVGAGIADLFNRVVVPKCSPPRDRALLFLSRFLRGAEGRASLAIMRLLPMPRPLGRRPDAKP